MTPKEMRLAAYFLDWFGEERSNAGCNDMPAEAFEAANFNSVEDHEFARQCLEGVHGITEEELRDAQFMRLQDREAMHLLAVKLRTEADFKTRQRS